MVKFIFLMAAAWGMMWLFFRLMYPRPPKNFPNMPNEKVQGKKVQGERGQAAHAQGYSNGAKTIDVLACAVCGEQVVDSIAIKKGEKAFCSAEHLTEFLKKQCQKLAT